MAGQQITQIVDGLIQRGRIQPAMRDNYISMLAASPELEQEFGAMFMMGSDYTNKTKQLANERKAAEDKLREGWSQINGERQRLQQWEGQVHEELSDYGRVMKEMPELTARMAAYEQTLRDYDMMDRVSVPPTRTHQPTHTPRDITSPAPTQRQQGQQTEGDHPYLTMDRAGRVLADYAALAGKAQRIGIEHYKLFGELLSDDLVTHYLSTGQDPEEFWKVKYGVENRRQEVSRQQQAASEAKMREDIRAELMREMALDPGRVVGGPFARQHKGGLTPNLEQYMQSRATQHGQNHANDQAATGAPQPPVDFIPPEKRPEIPAMRERLAAAERMFHENFDLYGNPTSDKGRRLANQYIGISQQ